MELPTRSPADRFTPPGRYRELENQIRCRVERDDIPILLVYAFDPRTRLGPFVFVDKTLIPGAPRAVGSALHAAGFHNVCLVLQQWNPNILPSAARFDGQTPTTPKQGFMEQVKTCVELFDVISGFEALNVEGT